jgi:N utilization substance protein B
MRSRTRAREAALRYLYEYDAHEGTGCPSPDAYFTLHKVPSEVGEYALRLLRGILPERESLDRAISAVAANWGLTRMAVIDRNVLRIGAWEILRAPDVPPEAAINEAVDLVKRYGSGQSGAFVNGILDRILSEARPPAAEIPAPAPAAPPALRETAEAEPSVGEGPVPVPGEAPGAGPETFAGDESGAVVPAPPPDSLAQKRSARGDGKAKRKATGKGPGKGLRKEPRKRTRKAPGETGTPPPGPASP